jgi:uncharacterized protein (DUF849 family)
MSARNQIGILFRRQYHCEQGSRFDFGVASLLHCRRVVLHAALNGTRTRAEYSAIPVTPAELAIEARASVAAGACAVHVHVRDEAGHESLSAADVANTIEAIRVACPGTPIGIGTGAWIIPDLHRRLAAIRSWTTLPDFASVNLHEADAPQVIELLLEKGVGVEAGIWNAPAAISLIRCGLADHCLRILLEPAEASCSARANLLQIEEVLAGGAPVRLLHGLGHCAWHLVELAARRRYDTRMGFEDTLKLPDGSWAGSNAELVTAARRIVEKTREICGVTTRSLRG